MTEVGTLNKQKETTLTPPPFQTDTEGEAGRTITSTDIRPIPYVINQSVFNKKQ